MTGPPAGEGERALPALFDGWFKRRGWQPYDHQRDMLAAGRAGADSLLIAPTGGGKTLAGFLPSLVELNERPRPGLHTLYISPLKALAQDIQRNLETPVAEMGLDVTVETRTGDTPQKKRDRQKRRMPNLLMTTPESLALMLADRRAGEALAGLRCVILDEIHSLVDSKRGDLLALGLARLAALAPYSRRVGLSATVPDIESVRAWLGGPRGSESVRVIQGAGATRAQITVLDDVESLPWAGHMGRHALDRVYAWLQDAATAIVFVNTRAQAELVFQALWRLNEDHLAIALHHGSLEVDKRRKVEAAMAAGQLRAVVATSSLDLGIDWAAVDLVVQIGAPKGATRLLQRIGRAGHRLDRPSRALLVPANRFEVLECHAAVQAIAQGTLDGAKRRSGSLDVLAQHVVGMACAGGVQPDALFGEATAAAPYSDLDRQTFDRVVDFCCYGGDALQAYTRFRRLKPRQRDGALVPASPRVAQDYRLNVGTIVEEPMVTVKLAKGRALGQVEEYFVQQLRQGDTFLFAGELLRFERLRETTAEVSRAKGREPKVPAYAGGRLPLSTHLSARVRGLLADPTARAQMPGPVAEWLGWQERRSWLPDPDGLLVETFPREKRWYLVAYCFEGRNAHQTLGMLLTRRMERAGLGPLGFVATDYVIAVWSLRPVDNAAALFAEDLLGDELEEWMAESSMLKRTFRHCAYISGLLARRQGGSEKTGRQMTLSSDLIYDVLRRYDPEHILLQATWADAAKGLIDVARVNDLLARARRNLQHRRLKRISPLAVPVILEVGQEQVAGEGLDEALDEAVQALVAEAAAEDSPEEAAQAAQGRLF